jgi:hypothetical protein
MRLAMIPIDKCILWCVLVVFTVGSAARAAAQGISKETENSQFQIMLVAQDTIEVLEKTTQKRTQ